MQLQFNQAWRNQFEFRIFFGIQKLFNYFGLYVTRRNPNVVIDDCWNGQLKLIGNDVKTIIEVGAADGRESLKYAQSCLGASVLAFEPLPESFKKLKASCASTKVAPAVIRLLGGLSFFATKSMEFITCNTIKTDSWLRALLFLYSKRRSDQIFNVEA